MGNCRRYVEIMVNTDETGEYCHRFCEFHPDGNYCQLFKQVLTKAIDSYNDFHEFIRLDDCKEHEI